MNSHNLNINKDNQNPSGTPPLWGGRERLFCFDFDGTITNKDTLLEFIKYAKGKGKFYAGFLRYSPLLVLMKLHLYPNYRVKQKVFSYFFKGESISNFNQLCRDFARENQHLIRQAAKTKIAEALNEGAEVFIVSASIDNWVAPFFEENEHLKILGTQIAVKDKEVTGRFLTKNCYGSEKVKRISKMLKYSREKYYIEAYGDSRGDKEMLSYADKGFYKPFRR